MPLLRRSGRGPSGVQADSANLSDLNRLDERVKTEAGRIDVLFVNAGGGSMLPLGSITEEQYDDTFGRNVKGALFTVQKALPLLVDGASVILNASNVSIKGTPAFSVYSASRAACATSPGAGRST
jgi:NAD(P)-dependent dehydrogenase (short-subunit alcohol dehydrogenase family)